MPLVANIVLQDFDPSITWPAVSVAVTLVIL